MIYSFYDWNHMSMLFFGAGIQYLFSISFYLWVSFAVRNFMNERSPDDTDSEEERDKKEQARSHEKEQQLKNLERQRSNVVV